MKSLIAALALVLLALSASAEELPAGPLVEAVVNAMLRDSMLAVRDVAATPPPGTEWFDLNTWVEAYRCISISRYEWSIAGQSADAATVDLRVYGSGFSAGNPFVEEMLPVHWRLGLVKRDGVWKIASAGRIEASLAPELVAAPNEETFRRLLTDPRVDPDQLLRHVGHQKNPASDAWALRRAKGFSADAVVVEMLTVFDADMEAAGGREPWRQASDIAYAAGDDDLIALAHLHAGIAIWLANDIPAALEHFRKASALSETVRDPRSPLRALHLQALIDSRRGEYTPAIRDAQAVMQRAKRFDWTPGVCGAWLLLAAVHGELRNEEIALRHNQEGLRCAEERAHPAQIAMALNNIANNPTMNPETDVTPLFRRALALAPGWLQDGTLAVIHGSLGGRLLPSPEGEEHLKTAVRLASQSREIAAWTGALLTLSDWHYREGRFKEALAHADEAGLASRQAEGSARTTGGDTWGGVLAARARALHALGEDAAAEKEFRAAIALIEQERGEMPADGTILSNTLERNVSPYQGLAALLIDTNRVHEAVGVSDAVKARTLRDLIAAGHVDIAARMTEPERAEERRLEEAVERVNTAMMKEAAGTPVYAGLEGQRESARQMLEQFRVELSMRRPGLRVRAATAHLDPLQSHAVVESDLILDYLVAETRTTLFVIRRGQVEAHVIPIGRKELEKRVTALLSLIEARDVRYAREAADLYRLLLGPAERFLTANPTACIIPDGPLWSVPFHALRDSSGKYVVERTAVYYAPSLGALHAPGNAPPRQASTVLAIGNPTLATATKDRATSVIRSATLGRLPHAEDEVAAIGKMYGPGAKVLIGASALESAAKSEAGKYDILHFAAHAIADNHQPLYSGVVLAAGANDGEDGILEAHELLDLDLRASLVVLAACSTGAGRFRAGEGVVGLAWAFLVAGCPRTIVTKWEVNSASTSQVMVDFHRRLRAGDTAPAALRAAQLRLMRDPRYSHPVDWAPFIALGAP